MGVREGKVEKYLVDEIEKIGGTAYKFVSPGRLGVSDRIVCYKGIVVFVEVKSPDYRAGLSSAQRRELVRLDENDHLTACCHRKVDVDLLVKSIVDDELIFYSRETRCRFAQSTGHVIRNFEAQFDEIQPIVSLNKHLWNKNVH